MAAGGVVVVTVAGGVVVVASMVAAVAATVFFYFLEKYLMSLVVTHSEVFAVCPTKSPRQRGPLPMLDCRGTFAVYYTRQRLCRVQTGLAHGKGPVSRGDGRGEPHFLHIYYKIYHFMKDNIAR